MLNWGNLNKNRNKTMKHVQTLKGPSRAPLRKGPITTRLPKNMRNVIYIGYDWLIYLLSICGWY